MKEPYNIIKDKLLDTDTKIIVMGDFNDHKFLITKSKPLTFKVRNKKLSIKHNKSKKELKKSLRSCCWHDKSNHYFKQAGDYILTNNQVKQLNMYIPYPFNKTTRSSNMSSDHKPVMSELEL